MDNAGIVTIKIATPRAVFILLKITIDRNSIQGCIRTNLAFHRFSLCFSYVFSPNWHAFFRHAVSVQSEERRGRNDGARRVGRAHQADCGVQGKHVGGETRRGGKLQLTIAASPSIAIDEQSINEIFPHSCGGVARVCSRASTPL